MHPGHAIVAHLRRIHFTGHIYVMASSNVKNMIARAGFNVAERVQLFVNILFL